MNCKITLKGSDDVGAVECAGDLEITPDGFELKYPLDGDSCVISCRNGTITQTRRGSLDIDVTFVKGRRTVCVIGGGELSGEIPVETQTLKYTTEGGLKVNIIYELGGATVNLNLNAEYA